MNLFENLDYVLQAKLLLLEQDKSRPRVQAFIAAPVSRLQKLESLVWDMYEANDLDTAEGVNLDQLGFLVGQLREGRTDTIYRLWIRARAYASRARGTADDFLFAASLVLEGSASMSYDDLADRDAEARLRIHNSAIPLIEIRNLMLLMKPAGVRLDVVQDVGVNAFTYDTGPGYDVGQYSDII